VTLHRVLTDVKNLSYLFYCFYREPYTAKPEARARKAQDGPWIPRAWKRFQAEAKLVLRQPFEQLPESAGDLPLSPGNLWLRPLMLGEHPLIVELAGFLSISSFSYDLYVFL
jgi:hypothetical protein